MDNPDVLGTYDNFRNTDRQIRFRIEAKENVQAIITKIKAIMKNALIFCYRDILRNLSFWLCHRV